MSSTITQISEFYPVWPIIDGKPLNLQWGEIRENTATTKAIVRGSLQDIEDDTDLLAAARTLSGFVFGDNDFNNRYRLIYDKDTEEFCGQQNAGTQAVPDWRDVYCVRLSDGQFRVLSEGGLFSSSGFYPFGLLPHDLKLISEVGAGEHLSFHYKEKLFFNRDDGFYLSRIKSGEHEGNPVVNMNRPFGRSQIFNMASSVEWIVNHGFGVSPVFVQPSDDQDVVLVPSKIDLSDPNTAYFYFATPKSGKVIVATGGLGAAELRPADPFYLVIRTDEQDAEGRIFRTNADLIFDASSFYVNVDLDLPGGGHKTAFVSLKDKDPIGVTFKDGTNTHLSRELNFNSENFYLSTDLEGRPVVNLIGSGSGVSDHGALSGLGDDDHTQYALVDGSRDFTNSVTIDNTGNATSAALTIDTDINTRAEVVYKEADVVVWRTGKHATSDEYVISIGEGSGEVVSISHSAEEDSLVIDDNSRIGLGTNAPTEKLHVVGSIYADGGITANRRMMAEAFYLEPGSGGGLWKDGDDVVLASSDGNIILESKVVLNPPHVENVAGRVLFNKNYSTTSGGVFVDAVEYFEPTVEVNSLLYIFSAMFMGGTFTQNASPTLDDFLFFNLNTSIKTVGTHAPMQSTGFLDQLRYVNDGGGGAIADAASHIGVEFMPILEATTSGDRMGVTELIGLRVRPQWDTVAGSTIDFGTVYGVRGDNPAQATSGTSAGTESLTDYFLVSMSNVTHALSGTRAVVHSLLAAGSQNRFLLNTGGAESDFGGGTLINLGSTQVSGYMIHPASSPAQITSDQADYAIPTGTSRRQVLRLSTDASRTIQSIVAASDGASLWIVNVGSNDLVLADQFTVGTTAANRIITNTGADLTLGPDEAALLWYDHETDRWRVLSTTGA